MVCGTGHGIERDTGARELSEEYNICPFEFSLELSNFCDVVICDYNYIFDFGGKAKVEALKILKEKYKCPFIIYMWDDLKYAKTIWETMDYFDERYIFNTEETEKYGFKYKAFKRKLKANYNSWVLL